MREERKTHSEILLELVASRTSALGDKQWGIEELVKHTGLRPHQVSNVIARMAREGRQRGETPALVIKTGARGQYVYTGQLKRGRKAQSPVAATPTEEVPFTEPLEDEGQVVAANEAAAPKTFVEGFAKIGEQMEQAMSGIATALGTNPPTGSEQALQPKVLRNNRVARIIRRMRELADEMGYLENEWEALTEKGRRYDKLTMTMFGFSSNDPAAVDGLRPDDAQA